MKNIILTFVLIIYSIVLSGQSVTKEKYSYPVAADSSLQLNIVVDNKVKLPTTEKQFYASMDALTSSVNSITSLYKSSYTSLENNLNELNTKFDSWSIDQNDARLSFFKDKFNLDEERIYTAIHRDTKIKLISLLIPFLCVLLLWIKLYKTKELDWGGFVAYATIAFTCAVGSFFIMYIALTSITNADYNVLTSIQSIF